MDPEGDDDGDDDDDDEGPVVPVHIGSDMSIEDATQRLRAASEGLDLEDGGFDETMSTVSVEPTGNYSGAGQPEATINFTAMRKSLSASEGAAVDSIPPVDQPQSTRPKITFPSTQIAPPSCASSLNIHSCHPNEINICATQIPV